MDYLNPAEITILPNRQRKKADPSGLIESIQRFGIINPIIVNEDKELIAGERRLRAALELGLDLVPVRYLEDLSNVERQVIELEENLSRVDLTWQETMEAVVKIWELKGKPPLQELADYLGRSTRWVERYLQANKAVQRDDSLKKLPTLNKVLNTERRRVRRLVSANTPVELTVDLAEEKPNAVQQHGEIIQADFIEWAAQANEQFNFIHVDFPYGVGMDVSGIKSEYNTKVYEDSPDVYFSLLAAFCEHFDRFAAEHCHVIFWFSNKFRNETVEMLKSAGLEVWRDPLIWCYGANIGITSKPDYFPRHSYETALLCYRGDRPLVKSGWDSYVLNPQRIDRVHPSEKPMDMLKHFFSMFIDETSTVLDPTCGSGNAISVALELGAKRALGIELDEEWAEIAKENINAKA